MTTPKLRFKGFKNVWNKTRLKYIANVKDGDWIESEYISDHGNYRIIQTGNIGVGNFIPKNKLKYISNKGFSELRGTEVKPDDLLICRLAEPVGRAILAPNIQEKMVTSVDVAIIYPKENVSKLFLKNLFNTNKMLNLSLRMSSGSTRIRISRKNLEKLDFMFPKNEDEQIKIGLFMYKMDELININNKKVNSLNKIKKSYLQKLLVKYNKLNPKLRLNNFSESWDTKKLKEISNIVGGGTPKTDVKEYWNGNINWFSPNEIGNSPYVSKSLKKITEIGLKKSSAKLHPINTLLFTSRAGIGKMAILKETATTNQGFQSLELKDGYDPYFVYSYKDELKRKAIILSSGSTFEEISKKSMESIELKFPIYEEQRKIGKLLELIDRQINLQKNKIKQLELVKKGYLQKMFI